MTEFWVVGRVVKSACGLVLITMPHGPAAFLFGVILLLHLNIQAEPQHARKQAFLMATRWTLRSFILLKDLIRFA